MAESPSLPRPYPLKFGNAEMPSNYDNSIDENSYSDESMEQSQAQQQDLRYAAVYGLFRQWLNDIRKEVRYNSQITKIIF